MTATPTKRRVPGEPGIWILVFGDLFVFGMFFGTFAYYRVMEPLIFRTSQAALNHGLGLLNTVLLLTSSLFVVLGLESAQRSRPVAGRRWTILAILCGLGFVGIKAVEYGEKFGSGIYPITNDFFMLYFAFTGIHLMHVLVGIGVLFFAQFRMTIGMDEAHFAILEGCTLFWHLVDMLWVVLFAIFYLHR